MDELRMMIQRHEGFRGHVYLDTGGNPTGGWGHHFWVGSKLPLEACEKLLDQDLADAVNEFFKLGKKRMDMLDIPRRRVILSMILSMNLQKVLGFRKMWKAIEMQDWDSASGEMINSKWADQVGKRALELAEIMRKGEDEVSEKIS